MLSVYWFPWRRDIGTIVTGGYLPGWISKTGSNGRLLLLFFSRLYAATKGKEITNGS